MAALEKITYQPLIDHLKVDESYYHHLLADHEIKHGRVDGSVITPWMVQVVQPIVIEVCDGDDAKISRVTRAFFKELIKQKSNGNLTLYAEAYKKAWAMLTKNGVLFVSQPAKILNALSSAMYTLHQYIPLEMMNWISVMEKTISICQCWNEFLNVGRVASWMVGLAMVREQANLDYNCLSIHLKEKLEECFSPNFSLKNGLAKSWYFFNQEVSYSYGGFIGYEGGTFELPPELFFEDGILIATDGIHHCVLFVDVCGGTLLREVNIEKYFVLKQGQRTKNTVLTRNIRNKYDDIYSLIEVGDCVIFTRKSSYKIFLRSNLDS